ncbi:hydroxypyruvate isomerase family protein [Tessaracoccus sp. ZS01]|uniref:hydroxypyruvate isomerase family protein n=1 Tax=Tessaracoccus sp. ZS01 TaxID=1906324 RepID=UPI00096FDF12|nr:TIM barrel protein [Tessaracoccus sp. ZS01]MCG6567839.1 hydroxypyruvate isomerase [Tessaracoccus sp. ZS01]OMG55570.1 hydroxypyruvate isomerase [Tessaracoccus sp. ZS01]
MSYTVNCSILLTGLPLLERAQAARDAGFDAVEFWWPFATSIPHAAEIGAFEASLRNAGVQLTGLNFNAGDMAAGERGLVSLPGRQDEFVANLDVVAGIGERTGCRAFNALYGLRDDAYTPDEQDAHAVEMLRKAADVVDRIGGTVLVEPVSGAEGYRLKTAADVLSVIAEVGRDNVKLLADFFHLAANDDDVAAVIEDHAADFGHIQIADFPGRGAPGTGSLPLATWLERSKELGYDGHIGLEYKQADEPFAFVGRGVLPGI